MRCDRCNRNIGEEGLVSLGSRRRFKNLCRACWTVETRHSNSRLISALNEITRRGTQERTASSRGERRGELDRRDRRDQRARFGEERAGGL